MQVDWGDFDFHLDGDWDGCFGGLFGGLLDELIWRTDLDG